MRNLCVTLLLALVVSNAMLGVHVATHISAEPSDCKLCTTYGDPTVALPTPALSLSTVFRPVEATRFSSEPVFSCSIQCVRQRGPPSLA